MTDVSYPLEFTVRHVTDLTSKDLASAEKTLGAAFKDDLFTRVVLANDYDFIPTFWGTTVIAGSLAGEVYFAETPEKEVIGVAVWFGPGREMYDSPDQEEKALAVLMARFKPELQGWWGDDFLPKYGSFVNETLGEGAKVANWHLQTLATHPDYQRRGVATALINVVQEKAAKSGHILCLEAEDRTNLMIYDKLGWEIKGEPTQFVGLTGEFPMWVLVEEPKKDSKN